MRGKSTIFLLSLLLIFKISTAQWQMTSGPALLAPNCIAKVDSILFVGTNNGIYKSVDEGVTWTPTNNGMTINSLKVLFVDNSIIYAGTNDGLFFPIGDDGIFKSTDLGNSWTKCKSGKVIQILSFDNKLIVRANDGYFSSQDTGISWQSETFPNGFSADLYAAKSNELFSCRYNGGIYSRHLSDTSWTRKSNNVVIDSSFTSIAVNDSILCVATTGDFFISTNLGASWFHPLNTGLVNSIITPLLIDSNFIFAGTNNGLYRTSNNGVSWALNYGSKTNCLLKSESKLYLGNEVGLYCSQDDGTTWSTIYTVYSNTSHVTSLASADSIILASFSNNVYLTNNDGDKWDKILPSTAFINSVNVFDSTLFIATSGAGIYKRNWSDTAWTSANNGIINVSTRVIIKSGTVLYAGNSHGVFSSINQGQNWTNISSNMGSRDVFALLVVGAKIYAGTSIGIYLSQNNGISWSIADLGIPDSSKVQALAIKDSILYAGTYGYGVYTSTNFGISWTASNSGITAPNPVIKFISVIGSNIFISSSSPSSPSISWLYISTTNGASWSLYSFAPNGAAFTVNSLAFNSSVLFAASNKGIVWKRPLSQLPNSCATTTTAKPYVCDYDSVLLLANNSPGFTYQWLKQGIPISGATSANYYAKQSGQYSCAFGGACVGSSPQFTLFGKAAPQPSISPPYHEICPQGDSALFFVDNPIPSYTFQWKHSSGLIPGATSQNYYAKIYGNYYCIVSDSFQCKGISNPVLLGFNPYADSLITAAGSTKICQGDSVRLDASNGVFSTHQWLFNGVAIPGALSPSYFAKQKGVYNCIETYNCVTLSIPITITYTPDCYFIPHPDTIISNVWHIENLCTGNSNLTYVWDWGDFTSSAGDSPAHLYSTTSKYNVCVTATDSSGCSNSYCDSIYASSIYITPSLATNSSTTIGSINKVEIYPIPFSNELTIELNTKDFKQIKIYNLFGNVIYQNQFESKLTINSIAFSKGIYIVELSDGKTLVHRKVYKD